MKKKNNPFWGFQHRFGGMRDAGCGMRDAGWGAKSRRNVGYEKYRGRDTGQKFLGGIGTRSFQLVECGIVLKLIAG